ncbi:MAG: T9SS type A sorting domain-containing protein [Bacteroidetes bacterium]|nr:T9SS type A sorting domain-containing protein [Bacteroidota bacterium]
MKKLILFAWLCFCFVELFSQSWCKAGATWRYGYGTFGAVGYTEVNVQKDTVFNGISCQKMEERNRYYSNQSQQFGDYSRFFYVHEDNGIVKCYDDYKKTWDTLYNFNLVPGDSSPIYGSVKKFYATDTGHAVVNGANLKWIKGNYHAFNQTNIDTIFERIGHIYIYPFEPGIDYFDGDYHNLCDYFDSCFTNLNPNSAICTKLPNGIKEPTLESKLHIYPNPTNGSLTLELNESQIKVTELNIYNLVGEKIYTNLIAPNTSHLSVNASYLIPGIYILSLGENYLKLVIE